VGITGEEILSGSPKRVTQARLEVRIAETAKSCFIRGMIYP